MDQTNFNKVPQQRRRRGAGRPRRFSRDEARAIRRRKAEGVTFADLQGETGVSVATLQSIVKGKGAYANTL